MYVYRFLHKSIQIIQTIYCLLYVGMYYIIYAMRIICLLVFNYFRFSSFCFYLVPLDPSPELTYCPYPGDIANGWAIHIPRLNERRRPSDEIEDEYQEGSQLQYSCEDGYDIEGSATLTCKSKGRWSSRPPTCKRGKIIYLIKLQ